MLHWCGLQMQVGWLGLTFVRLCCRMASRNASKYTEDGRFDEKRQPQFPAFERAILTFATTCLDEWREKVQGSQSPKCSVSGQHSDIAPYQYHLLLPTGNPAMDSCPFCNAGNATAQSLVDMEQEFVTAAFFRHAIAMRSDHLQQLEDMQQIMDGVPPAHPPAHSIAEAQHM